MDVVSYIKNINLILFGLVFKLYEEKYFIKYNIVFLGWFWMVF